MDGGIRTRAAGIFTVLILVLLAAATLPEPLSLTPRAAAVGTFTILSDTFEGAFPGTTWYVSDLNPASGLDYWGLNSTRAHTGTHSIWCAEVGNSSINGRANTVNGVYDNNMTAVMRYWLPSYGGIRNMTLTFWAWWSLDYGDWFSVRVESGTTGGDMWRVGQGSSNNSWVEVNVTIPPGGDVEFELQSDGAGVSVGAFVDDVTLVATDFSPPTITYDPITSAVVGQPIPVTAGVYDNVAVASATLYYESVGAMAFAALPMTANGSVYEATIPAQASSGTLRYYLEGRDEVGNNVTSPTAGAAGAYAVAVVPVPPVELPWNLIGFVTVILAVALIVLALVIRNRRASSRPGEGLAAQAPESPLPPTGPATEPTPQTRSPNQAAAGPPMPGLCPACGLQNSASAIYCNRCATRLR